MDLYEKIKLLASEKKMSIRQLEETLGFGNGVINRWRKNTHGSDKLKKVADYFNISVDYLLGRTDNPNSNNLEEDEITTFFRVNTEDLTESEKDQLREELKEYLEFMKSRLKNK
ncbi:helix-turn-helix transcriptional regulator [Enterococcus faecalis]|uniref:helix-turn-helix domain-containing protein n=1 Tax=Enterococcus faecalis TaxID=1351 RepID=UPI0030C80609